MLRKAKIRVGGHLSYYAITDNSAKYSSYHHYATRILFKWINRKSQRRAYAWEGYRQALKVGRVAAAEYPQRPESIS
jgi:hypothetical protein